MYERCGSIYVWSGVRSVLVAMRTSHNNARGQCRDIRLISYKLVIKTSLSFLYILKWKAIALIAVISTIGELRGNGGI